MQKLRLQIIIIFFIIFCFGFLDFLLFGLVMTDFLSLMRMGDVIPYNQTCALIGAIPLVMYVVVAMVRVLFTDDLQYKALPDPFEGWVLAAITLFFIIGFIANCIVPFLLLAFSYHSCPQDNLHDYHVTDVKLCETLVDNRSFW